MDLVLPFMPRGDTSTVDGAEVRRLDPLASLARAAAAGDRGATERLLRALGPRLLRVVRGVLGSGHPEVEDTLQDCLLLVVRSLPAYRGDGDVTGYAVRITLRAAIHARRRIRARAPVSEELPEDDRGELPPDAVSSARRREILRRLLSELPETQAEALALRVVLGHSLEEAAALAGVPENTLRSRIRLAREALEKRIAAQGLRDALEVEP